MKHFTDEQLEASADKARSRERMALHDMLLHLKEIDRRRLFSKRKFPSIHAYGMARFNYSYDEIHRRFCAMKLIKDMPELESKIIEGSLQLTHLTQAQGYFNKVSHTKEEKLQILAKLENTTKAETKKILYNEEVNVRYYFEAHKAFEVKVERAKGLHPHLSFDKLMEKIFDIALEQLDPTVKAEKIQAKEKARELKSRAGAKSLSAGAEVNKSRAGAKVVGPTGLADRAVGKLVAGNSRAGAKAPSRYIPAPVKREVWLAAKGKCQNCSSIYALEYDHIVPFAKGGVSTSDNLRLLCRKCNQLNGISHYGMAKMSQHLESWRKP